MELHLAPFTDRMHFHIDVGSIRHGGPIELFTGVTKADHYFHWAILIFIKWGGGWGVGGWGVVFNMCTLVHILVEQN